MEQGKSIPEELSRAITSSISSRDIMNIAEANGINGGSFLAVVRRARSYNERYRDCFDVLVEMAIKQQGKAMSALKTYEMM